MKKNYAMKDKNLKDQLIIPVYYWEDEDGYKVIDKEEMRKTFESRLKTLYLDTKLGKKEFYKKLFSDGKK